jgi:predicted nucleic acid-binding protein
LPFEFGAILERSDPPRWTKTLRYRGQSELPYGTAIPEGMPLLLDTTVYIDEVQGRMRPATMEFIAGREIYHAAPALAELALTLGHLDPNDVRTASAIDPLLDMFEALNPTRVIAPDASLWVEAAILAGILARTQHIPKEDRRKFLNDTLLYLMAAQSGFALISRNVRDLDLLLQIRPGVDVLLYERA